MSYYRQDFFVMIVSPDIYQYLHMNSLFLRCVLECQAHRTILCISVISIIEPWIFSGVSNAGFSIDRGTEGMAAWWKMPSVSRHQVLVDLKISDAPLHKVEMRIIK